MTMKGSDNDNCETAKGHTQMKRKREDHKKKENEN